MTRGRPYDREAAGELELRDRRRRTADLTLMLAWEVLCAVAGVAAFLAFARHELDLAAVFAIASAIAYLGAEEADRT